MIALFIAAMGFAQTKSLSDVKKAMPFSFTKTAKHTYNFARQTRDNDQALVVLSAGDIWEDGTGYQLLIDTDNAGYDAEAMEGAPECGSTYSQWEYMIPANASANDANVVVNATESIYITPGTYSYLILNPGCSDYETVYIASDECDSPNASDFEFEAGKMYTFTLSLNDSGHDCVTLTIEDIPTDPIMTTTTTALSFVAEINETSNAEQVLINAMNLTEEITATVTAPFEVSSDNITFGTTATLTTDGGSFYVRFVATATAGTQTGTMTVASTGANNLTIALTGIAYECSSTISAPWTESFDANSTTVYCWSISDGNSDGYSYGRMRDENDNFFMATTGGQDGNDDYLISPVLTIGNNNVASFKVAHYVYLYYGIYEIPYPATYAVYAIVGDNEPVEIREATETSTVLPEFETVYVDLSAYAGQNIQIAIRDLTEEPYYFFVDDFSLFEVSDPEIELTSISIADGATIPAGNINISGVVTNLGVNLTSYKVSYTVDGGNAVEEEINGINVAMGETHNFTHSTPIALEAGNHSITVTISDPNGAEDGDDSDNTITVNITVIDCDVISTIPYSQNFDNLTACWTIISNNNANTEEDFGVIDLEGENVFSFSSYETAETGDYNQYLITPELALTEDVVLTFDYAKSNNANELFRVMTSTTSRDIASFTALEDTVTATSTEFTEYRAIIPAETKFIAINYFSNYKYFLYIDNFSLNLNTSVEENIAEAIAVYPNPTSDMVTIANAEGKNIIVVNSLGQVVASIENAAANQTINVANFANGTYFVKVDGEVVKLNVVK